MRLLSRLARLGLGEREQALLRLAQKLGRRAIDPGDRLVTDGAVEIMVLEILQPASICVPHRLVGAEELPDQLGRVGIGDAPAQAVRDRAHLAFALLKGGPMLVQRFRLLAAQKRVLPLLNLLLEVDLDCLDIDRVALARHHVFFEHAKAFGVTPEAERGRGDHEQRADCEKQKDPPAHHQQGAAFWLVVHVKVSKWIGSRPRTMGPRWKAGPRIEAPETCTWNAHGAYRSSKTIAETGDSG